MPRTLGGPGRSETAEQDVRTPPFGAPHVFILAVMDGDAPSAVHRITRSETVLGRGEESSFPIDDDVVSTNHCAIRVDGPVCTIRDLESLNGTRYNGRPLKPGVAQRLRHLDQIQIGNTHLLLLMGRFTQQISRA